MIFSFLTYLAAVGCLSLSGKINVAKSFHDWHKLILIIEKFVDDWRGFALIIRAFAF